MANRYWVGGGSSSNWNATGNTNWGTASNTQDNAAEPTAADDVFFDGVGTGAADCVISANAVCRSINCTGYANTITHNAGVTLAVGDATAGASNVALAFDPDMTYTLGSGTTSAISFISSSATQQTIDFAEKITGNAGIGSGSVSGNYQLTGQWGTSSVNVDQTTTYTKGTFDFNGQTCHFGRFISAASPTGTLTLGASTIYLYQDGTDAAWYLASGLTVSAASSTIIFDSATAYTSTAFTQNFNSAGYTYGTIQVNGSGTFVMLANGATVTCANLYRIGAAAASALMFKSTSSAFVVTGEFKAQGNSSKYRVLVHDETLGTSQSLTLTGATISNCQNVNFRDIGFVSTNNLDFSAITGGSGDCGGNTISGGGALTFTTATDWYFYETTNNGTANNFDWSENDNWYTGSGGTGSQMGATLSPLPQDNLRFDASSILGASRIIIADMARLGKNINFTSVTNSPTWRTNSFNTEIYGSLTLVSGMTFTPGAFTNYLMGRGSFTLTSSGKTAWSVNIYAPTGTYTLQDDLSIGYTLALTAGTFDANNRNINTPIFSCSVTTARTLTMGSGTWTLSGSGNCWNFLTTTNLTLNSDTAIIAFTYTGSLSISVIGGSKTFYKMTFVGSTASIVQFTDSITVGELVFGAGRTYRPTLGKTITVTTFAPTGTSGNVITIDTSVAGSAATFSKSSGVMNFSYCSIKDITVAGGATGHACDSTNVSGNTNIDFSWLQKVRNIFVNQKRKI
jgi:hypothetical protein